MRKIQVSLLLSVVIFATGCPKPKYQPSVNFKNPTQLVAEINYYIDTQRQAYNAALDANPPNIDKARRIRNELIEGALPYIDGSYSDFIADKQAGRDRDNFVLDLIDLSTAASVGITKGERALQVIGVGLTAFRGGRKSADANFYKDTSMPILISKMDGNRAKVHAAILEKESKPVADYPLGAAVADIVEYYNAGTLVRAFTQLQQDTAIKTQESESKLADIKKNLGIKGAPTAEEIKASAENSAALRALWAPFGAANKKLETAEKTIATANTDIDNAGPEITAADQSIGEATAKVNAATTKTAKATAQAALDSANASKLVAETKKSSAETTKRAAEEAKATAIIARDDAFKKLQGVYQAIAADSKLSPYLDKVTDNPTLTAKRKRDLQGFLDLIKENKTPETDDDKKNLAMAYANVLGDFSIIVIDKFKDEPELNQHLQEILKANK